MCHGISTGLRAALALLLSLAIAGPSWAQGLPDFARIFRENRESVVNISTTPKETEEQEEGRTIPGIPEDSPLFEFFERFFGSPMLPRMPRGRSLGSGFIISEDGYILTAAHVIANAEEVYVTLGDRRELLAKLIGFDKLSDVALLKIEDGHLRPVKIGNSSRLEVGQWVLAIGTPFGFEYSATQGIISALGRSLPTETYVPFIQTDVAVNPGSSGGPLFNLEGEVVGINAQIYSGTGGYMGLSFAIPINVATDVAQQLRTEGKVSRGWLGVTIQDVTADLAQSFGLDQPRGALVAGVMPGSPAAKAGLQPGDILVSFDGTPIQASSELPPLVASAKEGKQVPLTIVRNGKSQTLTVTTGELPAEEEPKETQVGAGEIGETRLNLAVADISPEQRKRLSLPEHGVLVEDVGEGPAERAGIRPGDIILKLNNIEVKDAADLKRVIKDLPEGKPVPVLIQREGNPLFLAVEIPENK
jgi:serine protease Do